jgi:hypothetical protein
MSPRAILRVAALAAACACIAGVGACGASSGNDHCLNPQPLPPFCGPEPLPPTGQVPSDDAGTADPEAGPDAGAN